jgi:pimeloyl-ACP methyl ester carboxylesterase
VAAPRTRYARSGDVHLAYQVIGDGPRDMVLVLDWVSHLSRGSRGSSGFDMRGIGLSDRVAEDAVAPEEWMEDVGAVMDAAGSERATLLAHGHAAQMALLYAAS